MIQDGGGKGVGLMRNTCVFKWGTEKAGKEETGGVFFD